MAPLGRRPESREVLLRYVVVYNPIAGQGRAAGVAGDVQAYLEEHGHSAELRASERAGHIAEIASALVEAGTCDRLLVLGGDGSLREAAAGLLAGPSSSSGPKPVWTPELGILPFGTGNVVARELQLPLEPLAAAAAMEASGSVPFDVGWAAPDGGAPEPFLAMIGAGFDASVARWIGSARASRFGGAVYKRGASLLYVAGGARQLAALFPARFSVSVEGEAFADRAVAAVLSNTETYGKGMAMSPGASPNDGVLDLNVRASSAPWAAVSSLVSAQLRKEGASLWTKRTRGASAVFESGVKGASLAWQLDGDPMPPASRVEVSLAPSALRLIGRLPGV